MSPSQIRCPVCSTQALPDDVNMHNMAAFCRRCNQLFSINAPGSSTSPADLGEEPSRPPGLRIEKGFGKEVKIVLSWFQYSLFFLLFFCIAWDSFLVFWYAMAINGPWLMIVFPIVHVAVGVGLTYSVVAGFLNRTRIIVNSASLRVRHGPIPWSGNRDLLIQDVERVEIERGVGVAVGHSRRRRHYSRAAMGANLSVTVRGELVRLLRGIEVKKAKYIAWQLATAMGVPLLDED